MFALRTRATKRAASLDDLAATQALVDALPRDDSLGVLRELAAHLDGMQARDQIKPFGAFEIVDLVDRSGRPHYRKAAREYVLGQRRLTKFQETQLWTSVSAYLIELCQGYRYCLAKHEVGADSGRTLTPVLPVLCARAVRAYAARLKWCYLRYRPIEPRQWTELNALYLLAEAGGFARESVPLYRGAPQESSVEREFLKTLMLAISSPAALLPEQIEIAERLVARSIGDFVIASECAKPLRHVVDLRSGTGPQRLSDSRTPPTSARTFGAGMAVERLRALDRDFEQGDITPGELSLTQEFDSEAIRATIRHLLSEWGPALRLRRHDRQRKYTTVTVVHGFDEVAANVGGLAYPFVTEQENWLVDNQSDSGLHALVMSPQGRWIEVGSLVAFRHADESIWSTGLVRRINREDDDTRHVAVERVAHGGAAVTVLPLVTASKKEPAEGVVCTLLSGRNTASDELTLLLPPRTFSASAAREMRALDRRYRLVPIHLVETGDGYEIARFKVLQVAGAD